MFASGTTFVPAPSIFGSSLFAAPAPAPVPSPEVQKLLEAIRDQT